VKKRKKQDHTKEYQNMKIAVPVVKGELCRHFGHCEYFAIFDVDTSKRSILNRNDIPSPPHEPGVLPLWLSRQGADVIIAGGIGSRARTLFTDHGIDVITGAPTESPENLVSGFLSGTLVTTANECDH
jgi:ATP-binding protein involved in chromosome partitioning